MTEDFWFISIQKFMNDDLESLRKVYKGNKIEILGLNKCKLNANMLLNNQYINWPPRETGIKPSVRLNQIALKRHTLLGKQFATGN